MAESKRLLLSVGKSLNQTMLICKSGIAIAELIETYESIPSPLSAISNSVEIIESFPTLDSSFVFGNVEYVTEDTHAWIDKVLLIVGTVSKTYLKIFRKDRMVQYNLEMYEYLRHSDVTYRILRVYGTGIRMGAGRNRGRSDWRNFDGVA